MNKFSSPDNNKNWVLIILFFIYFADQFQYQEPTSYAINCEIQYVGT